MRAKTLSGLASARQPPRSVPVSPYTLGDAGRTVQSTWALSAGTSASTRNRAAGTRVPCVKNATRSRSEAVVVTGSRRRRCAHGPAAATLEDFPEPQLEDDEV